MERDRVIAQLRAHETELRAAGVAGLALFGSVARGDDTSVSDVDLLVRLTGEAASGGFTYIARVAALTDRLAKILGRPVDVVTEPVRKERLRRQIEKDGVLAF